LKVVYVHPWGTSSRCAVCGSKVLESKDRMVYCPSCGTRVDRDMNAARNIAGRGRRFVPVGVSGEAVNQFKDGESMTLSQANGQQPKT
jgi:putative transposase